MWLRRLAELARGASRTVFPNACLICDAPETDHTAFRHGLCSACFRALETDTTPRCSRCAATVGPFTDTETGCMVCRGAGFAFDTAFRLGPYAGRLREAILRMKSQSGEALAEMLGRVYAATAGTGVRASGVEVVVPVPLHWRRWWARGHNQASGVARELAAGLGMTFCRALRRVRHTPQQAQPSAAARHENVRGAFRVRAIHPIAGRRVLLVDDVMTTGSTATEAARTLVAAGATGVVVAVLARR